MNRKEEKALHTFFEQVRGFDIYDKLKIYAKAEGVSCKYIIKIAIEEFLKKRNLQ